MSIGSWQRSTPGATSVTSGTASSCSWRRGRSAIVRSVRRAPARAATRDTIRAGGVGVVRGGVDRSGGCCCGRPAGCRQHGSDRPAARRRRPGARRGRRAAPPARSAARPAPPRRRARRRRRPLVRRHGRRRRRPRRDGRRRAGAPAGLGRQAARLLDRCRRNDRADCSCSSTPTSGPDRTCSTGWRRSAATDAVVSVQPWHDAPGPGRARQRRHADGQRRVHRARRTAAHDRRLRPGAGVDPADVRPRGGHAHPDVRASLTEDIALARRVGRSRIASDRRDALDAAGRDGHGRWPPASAPTRWWLVLAVAAWVWSLAGGLFAGWLAYPLSARAGVGPRPAGRSRRAGRRRLLPACSSSCSSASSSARLANRLRGTTTWKGRAGQGGVTSSRILPTLASASMCRWASATSSSGKRRSITGSQRAGGEQRQHLVGEAPADGDLLLERPRAQHGADPADPLGQQQPDVDRGRAAAHQADLDDRALRPHGGEVAVDLLAADRRRARRRHRRAGRPRPARRAARPASRPASARARGRRRAHGRRRPCRPSTSRRRGRRWPWRSGWPPCRRRTPRRGPAPSARSSGRPARRGRPRR